MVHFLGRVLHFGGNVSFGVSEAFLRKVVQFLDTWCILGAIVLLRRIGAFLENCDFLGGEEWYFLGEMVQFLQVVHFEGYYFGGSGSFL